MVHLLGSENSAVINAEILEFVAQTTFQSHLRLKKKTTQHISQNIT